MSDTQITDLALPKQWVEGCAGMFREMNSSVTGWQTCAAFVDHLLERCLSSFAPALLSIGHRIHIRHNNMNASVQIWLSGMRSPVVERQLVESWPARPRQARSSDW
eukprot:2574048-Amphidinium_carterae.1